MTDAKKSEEIIELTDVVEGERGPGGRDRPIPSSPPASEGKISRPGPDQRSDKSLEPRLEESRALSRSYESESRAMKDAVMAGVDEWMASQGVRVLERIAREIFPKIAREVLGQEVEKLKAEIRSGSETGTK